MSKLDEVPGSIRIFYLILAVWIAGVFWDIFPDSYRFPMIFTCVIGFVWAVTYWLRDL